MRVDAVSVWFLFSSQNSERNLQWTFTCNSSKESQNTYKNTKLHFINEFQNIGSISHLHFMNGHINAMINAMVTIWKFNRRASPLFLVGFFPETNYIVMISFQSKYFKAWNFESLLVKYYLVCMPLWRCRDNWEIIWSRKLNRQVALG